MTLADVIARNAAFAPDKVALCCGGSTLSYAALSAEIERVAAGLSREYGVGRGDRIAHLGYNSIEFLVLLFAAARLGAMLVPINWRLAVPEQAYVIESAMPAVLVVEMAFSDRVAALVSVHSEMRVLDCDRLRAFATAAAAAPQSGGDLDDPLLIVYTSGTTGRPKGAVLGQRALLGNAMQSIHMHGMTAADHVLTVLPLFHVGGLNIQTTPALIAGATVTLLPRFAPAETLEAIAVHRPTLTVLVPATLDALFVHPGFDAADLSSLRCVTTGSTIIPDDLVLACAGRGIRLLQVYGSTETGPVVIYERFDQPRTVAGSTGVAGLLSSAMIVDDTGMAVADGVAGEIAVKAPNLLSGYWRDEVATHAAFRDGWYLTGDVATRTADGHFIVHDRKRNVIISGGENIYPAEVERVIGAFAGVADCAVVGRVDAKWQEVPIAFVVPRAGASIDVGALEAHLAANLARFKLPRAIVLRDTLPKTALGKVQHAALKDSLNGT